MDIVTKIDKLLEQYGSYMFGTLNLNFVDTVKECKSEIEKLRKQLEILKKEKE